LSNVKMVADRHRHAA